MAGTLFIVGTPIGNLEDITLRALRILKEVDVIYCEDTRRTLKLLNHFEIRKPLKSAPYFKEREAAAKIEEHLSRGESVALVSDAGMPGISDPGSLVIHAIREKKYAIEIIGGVSSLTHFICGAGASLEKFRFVGFLPPRVKDRESFFSGDSSEPVIFFESPHRIESTIEILARLFPERRLTLGKEFTKISEAFFFGRTSEIRKQISSTKGEWVGCLWPESNKES